MALHQAAQGFGALPEAEREDVLARVWGLFEGMPSRFPVPYHTELWWCRAR